MPIVSEQYPRLIGVDTHAATHTLAVVDAVTGAELDQTSFPATQAGLDRAVAWVTRHGDERESLLVVEGIGSFGAGIARRLLAAGQVVVEPAVMTAGSRRGHGKSDPLDAARIARSVAGVDLSLLRRPREDGGTRSALQILTVAREEMTTEHTRLINSLTALVRTFELGIDARKPLSKSTIGSVSRWRSRAGEPIASATARNEAIRLASRIRDLDHDLADNKQNIQALVGEHAPGLLDKPGIGPVVAATVLVAWSHPGRVRSEAALASLAGTCPIPASSGNTVRHRLNRGGDRRLNRAITTIALVRMRIDPATKAYVAKRTAQGRTKKEIMRSLKRYITRQLFRTLAPKTVPTTP